MPTIPSSLYYVYELCWPDGTVFYVGKGTAARLFIHLREAFRNCECRKCQTIRAIWTSGEEVRHLIVFETDNELAAYSYETARIAAHGRTNLTNEHPGIAIHTSPQKRKARKRPHGSGSIYQRSDGQWFAAVQLPSDANEKRKRKVFYAKSKADAVAKLKEFERKRQERLKVLHELARER